MHLLKAILTIFVLLGISTVAWGKEACSTSKQNQIFARASSDTKTVTINCNLTFPSFTSKITKRVHIKGNSGTGVTINCRGGSIDPIYSGYSLSIYSPKTGAESWEQIRNVTIKNCKIYGRVKVYGMATSGEGEDLRESSYHAGHTTRAQAAAPKYITFDNDTFIAQGSNPLYFSPGVTYSTVKNSELKGYANSVAIYLDAESGHNTIENNYIHVSNSREQIAVDGSAYNKIINNRFSALSNGGIYLYRNCGEGGTVRHQTPSHNQIINNYFYYNTYSGSNPAIWAGSRNGARTYCNNDAGHPFGSSISNQDYAMYNVIAQNQIRNRSVSDMIKQNSAPNYYFSNQRVSSRISRSAGCYYNFTGAPMFVNSGDYAARDYYMSYGLKYYCRNARTSNVYWAYKYKVSFNCIRTGSNYGCSKRVYCPYNKKLVSARAGCNLEWGGVNDVDLYSLYWNNVKVMRSSDNTSSGRCSILGLPSISSGQRYIGHLVKNQRSFPIYCREHDKNGGDCVVRGEAFCL